MRTVLITGKGRSGTTWLGRILNTHPHCCYKYEPFLPLKSNGYGRLRSQLGRLPIDHLRQDYEQLIRTAIYDVDIPFDVPKTTHRYETSIARVLHKLTSKVRLFEPAFSAYARPRLHEAADILIKDVNFPNELLPHLAEVIKPLLIAVVRNPFANIASFLVGIEKGLFRAPQDAEYARVEALLADEALPASLRAYAGRVRSLSPVAFEAVRWRLQVEPLVAFSSTYERSQLVLYQDLCQDPIGVSQRLFDFIGWPLQEGTRAFIERSVSGPPARRGNKRAYYGVRRDPRQAMNKWREQLSEAQKVDIARVVDGSPVRHFWPLEA